MDAGCLSPLCSWCTQHLHDQKPSSSALAPALATAHAAATAGRLRAALLEGTAVVALPASESASASLRRSRRPSAWPSLCRPDARCSASPRLAAAAAGTGRLGRVERRVTTRDGRFCECTPHSGAKASRRALRHATRQHATRAVSQPPIAPPATSRRELPRPELASRKTAELLSWSVRFFPLQERASSL
eukprot:364782-Chlamydomonas_euryale.AAC.3